MTTKLRQFDQLMRKINKAVLTNYLLSTTTPITQSNGSQYVLDGGPLLHRWRGGGQEQVHGHHSRGSRYPSYIRLEENMSVDVDQELLFANNNNENKKQFISL